ncbi:DUF802 domain-containing protein [Luteimonas yindakuii]|uniref:DUF802 domain-containing protein n=1 Tax=Luteimonas yindakuii TaxID=2565782 RepID=A0A4Z1RN65_9GAMM|nr:DUF802 domain-containing protein [Luteimonas yindakuii]TKS55141.1 DUF802 domain-containing protein [Luteimonas yindakuii]
MNRHLIHWPVFATGLLAIGWIGAGYLGSHTLALAVTLLIAALYLVGALELHRYRQATATLDRALDGLAEPPAVLADWLEQVDAALRGAVRLRVEEGRGPLPVPSLTPYLVGMLVLLGMLGTLLGMLLTLRGTGMALQTASDLQAVRDSLAAPVEGLGVAFGTSIAGVAASAMLGLLSALCRSERAAVVRRLDSAIATTLRLHSPAQQRDETLQLMRAQSTVMPALVERLQDMMAALDRQAQAAHAHQTAQQDSFHAGTAAAYERLAASVEQSLQRSASDSARAFGDALQPVVATTMEAVTRETTRLHQTVAAAVDSQLQALSAGVEANGQAMATLWRQALEQQREAQATLAATTRDHMDQVGTRFTEHAATLVDAVATQLDGTAARIGSAWDAALERQQAQHAQLVAQQQAALVAAGDGLASRAQTLLDDIAASHARLQDALASGDEQRLATWNREFSAIGTALRADWARIGDEAAQRQQAICDALARTAQQIGEQAQAHASATITEIATLVQAASEAPRAAAEVVAELRQKLSDSMVRDTELLAERAQLMDTLATLLDAVNHASVQQREAIDALVSTSAGLLERVGDRFVAQVEGETGKLDDAATRVGVGAAEVASLGEAFAGAVELFGASNERLLERLDGIGATLDATATRSDEQLAYYVAQAREVVDLSVLAQKQIIEELRQLPRVRDRVDA